MKLKKNKEEDESVRRSSDLFMEPLFSPQLSRIWGPTSGSGDNSSELPDPLTRGILKGAQQCGFNPQASRKGNMGDWEDEDVVDSNKDQEDVVDSDYKFGPSILWLDQFNSYEENNCTVEIGKGYLDGVLTHEFLMQRHGQVVNCACGHNVDALKVAKQGVALAKDLQSLFICSPSTIMLHRHCVRVLTPCTELNLQELMTSRRNLREGLEEHARFLAACLVEATTFLHGRNILHRDVAPHNVFLDHRGYAKLANFHHAVCGAPGQYFKGYCGTMGYQAPEVVACLGHMHTLDYWGIGTVVYQFLFGFSPFADEDLGRLRSKTVLNPEFAITRLGNRFRHVSHHGQDAIKSMLCKYPHKRLGYRYQEANKIKWFHPYRWTSLARQQMVSPLASFLEEELESTQSPSFHAPVTHSMSSNHQDMDRSTWEMVQPMPSNSATSWQKQTSPSSSASNCSNISINNNIGNNIGSNNTSNFSSNSNIVSSSSGGQIDDKRTMLFQKMFGRAPGDNSPVAPPTGEAEETEKHLTEKTEKEITNKAKKCADVSVLNNLDEPNRSVKNADNFEKLSSKKSYQGNSVQASGGESKTKVPDPNSPPFVPSQASAYQGNSVNENYVNAQLYAAAHLLQYGNTGWAGGAGYGPEQTVMTQYASGPMYTHQYAPQWNPAEGDGINHQNHPAIKSQLYTAAQNWLLRNGRQSNGQNKTDVATQAINSAGRYQAAYDTYADQGQYSYYPACNQPVIITDDPNNVIDNGDNCGFQPTTGIDAQTTAGINSGMRSFGMQTSKCSSVDDKIVEGMDKSGGDSLGGSVIPKGKSMHYGQTATKLPQKFLSDNAN